MQVIINNLFDSLFKTHTFELLVNEKVVFTFDYGYLFTWIFVFLMCMYISTMLFKVVEFFIHD